MPGTLSNEGIGSQKLYHAQTCSRDGLRRAGLGLSLQYLQLYLGTPYHTIAPGLSFVGFCCTQALPPSLEKRLQELKSTSLSFAGSEPEGPL